MHDERGRLHSFAKVTRDLTESWQQQEQFRLALESAPTGMVLVDQSGKIVLVNAQVERLFGYNRQELLDQPVEMLVPTRARERHPAYRESFQDDPQARPMGAGRDLYGRRKDGSELPVEIGLNPLQTEHGVFVLASIVDMTERKWAEEHMKGSLKEKETLLKEIHHRVKNNLQIISSLLSLQSNYIKDPTPLAMFQDSQNRSKSMALVHEKLYQSSDLSRISMAEYLQELVTQLQQSYGVRETIRFVVYAEDVFLSIDLAVPCALIAHELVVNAIKHAFPQPRSGEVTVKLTRGINDTCVLAIADTGIGLPPDLDVQQTDSLGLSLVTDLVDQLHATVALGRDQGTTWSITFPVKMEIDRLYAISTDSYR
jgi:two-component system, sensor histidine kinase PdtaS